MKGLSKFLLIQKLQALEREIGTGPGKRILDQEKEQKIQETTKPRGSSNRKKRKQRYNKKVKTKAKTEEDKAKESQERRPFDDKSERDPASKLRMIKWMPNLADRQKASGGI